MEHPDEDKLERQESSVKYWGVVPLIYLPLIVLLVRNKKWGNFLIHPRMELQSVSGKVIIHWDGDVADEWSRRYIEKEVLPYFRSVYPRTMRTMIFAIQSALATRRNECLSPIAK